MNDALIHPVTKTALENVASGQHHATALIGPYGAGKGFLATKLADMMLGDDYSEHQIFRIISGTTSHLGLRQDGRRGVVPDSSDSSGGVSERYVSGGDEMSGAGNRRSDPKKQVIRGAKEQSIGIEEIRSIQSFLRLRFPGTKATRRILIIEDAHYLTIEAQNALLKTLEEPPADAKIILTITGTTSLRQTIYSRLQQIHIRPCTLGQTTEYFRAQNGEYDAAAIRKAHLISRGYAGLLIALVRDQEHALSAAINDAKTFLSTDTYERMLKVDALSKDKEKAALLLYALKRVLSAAAQGAKDSTAQAMAGRLRIIYMAEKTLVSNPNTKLLLTDLALAL